jgi:hypothetical protein
MNNKPCPNCKRLTYETKCDCGYTKVKQFITANDYFMCRTRNRNHPAYGKDFRYVSGYKEEWTPQIQENAENLVKLINTLFTEIEALTRKSISLNITSGWRPSKYSKEIGTSIRSAHVTGQAIDLADIGNKKFNLITAHMDLIILKDLYLEDSRWTKSWLHVQTRPTRNRIFIP